MPGGITYNGVSVENGGQIFEGLQFWVSQRVPTRTTILEHIRNNSGVIVRLEKDADYLVADHARKDAPSGSISWKFITESVENGVVQLPDRYKISHAPAGPREAASGRPTRGPRAKFTEEEDAVLARWVLSHDKDRTGNEIYKRFETMYPSHPWQSWRNRFVKKLNLLPHESLLQIASRAPDGPTAEAAEEAQQDQELPDPTELMLQRRGQRVQQEAAAQRTQKRVADAPQTQARSAAPQPAPQPAQQTAELEDTAETEAKNAFYEDLQMFSEERGFEIAPTQQVAGQPVELWELSKAVSEQRLPAEEIDWLRVAEDIGYTWLDTNAAVRSLQHCYEENLAEFLEVMQDTIDGAEDEGELEEFDATEELAASTAAQQAAFDRIASSRAQLPSSPPERFLRAKRALDDDGEVIIPTPAKKRRLYIPPEVPSTPDTDRQCHEPVSNTSRRLSVAATPIQFETQPPPPPLQTHESSFDMTPSQQLQSEHINTSPIPLRLNSAAKNQQVGAAGPSSSSKQSNTSAKRRVLPRDFKPPEPIEEESSLFVPEDNEDQAAAPEESQFSAALPDPQPPRPPVGRPAQVVAATRRMSKQEELSDLIQHYESLGYAHKTVVEGLRRTTMTPGLATVVMQSLHEGQGVPSHHEGIWTDRDDEGLRLVNSIADLDVDVPDKDEMKKIRRARRARTRLLDKHGQDRMKLRMKYLRANDSLTAAAAAEEQAAAA